MSGYLGSDRLCLSSRHGRVGRQDGRKGRLREAGTWGFGQYMVEFTTAVKYGMEYLPRLMNNGELGKISKSSATVSVPVWQTSLTNRAVAEVARLCGVSASASRTPVSWGKHFERGWPLTARRSSR
jgi:pyruvate oxidase